MARKVGELSESARESGRSQASDPRARQERSIALGGTSDAPAFLSIGPWFSTRSSVTRIGPMPINPPTARRYLVGFDPRDLPHHFTDVLIIGGGIAGFRTAL